MLEMKTTCEKCGGETPATGEAFICSYECTWCPDCAASMDSCPNCGGILSPRPTRV